MVKAARIGALAFSLISASLLSGCGFQPLYAGPGFNALPGLSIEAGDNRIDYLVEDALRDYLGEGRSAYSVELQSMYRETPLGLSAAGRAGRFSANLNLNYVLTGPDGFEQAGRITETVFYDAPSDPYALIAAREAAEERAAERAAERLAQEFAIILQQANRELES